MFATDLACKFGAEGGKGSRAEVYAPDLRNQSVEYTVEYVGYDPLLGSFIQLTYQDQAFYLGHTESKLKIGDKITTGQRLGQMILN
jgi:ribosomal protein L2